MSHLAERSEKNCLNCNAEVHGRFCHICGQENVAPRESVFHLVNHFFQDITHFDGKFFSSMKWLFTRPGYLPAEYNRGRRASHLNPIRMYVFTSAFFFLIFFKFIAPHTETDTETSFPTADSAIRYMQANLKEVQTKADFVSNAQRKTRLSEKAKILQEKLFLMQKDSSIAIDMAEKYRGEEEGFLNLVGDSRYTSVPVYDSIQHSLPEAQRDGFLKRLLQHKAIEQNAKYRKNPGRVKDKLTESYFHKFPQIMFVSLPFMALLLHVLYLRQKKYYYVSHLIFTIYLFIFSYLMILVQLGFSALGDYTHWKLFDVLAGISVFYLLYYQYKAMRKFYGQRRGKTILKWFLLNFFSLLGSIIIFALFFFLSFFQL